MSFVSDRGDSPLDSHSLSSFSGYTGVNLFKILSDDILWGIYEV